MTLDSLIKSFTSGEITIDQMRVALAGYRVTDGEMVTRLGVEVVRLRGELTMLKANDGKCKPLADFLSSRLGPDGKHALMHSNHACEVALAWLRAYEERDRQAFDSKTEELIKEVVDAAHSCGSMGGSVIAHYTQAACDKAANRLRAGLRAKAACSVSAEAAIDALVQAAVYSENAARQADASDGDGADVQEAVDARRAVEKAKSDLRGLIAAKEAQS